MLRRISECSIAKKQSTSFALEDFHFLPFRCELIWNLELWAEDNYSSLAQSVAIAPTI